MSRLQDYQGIVNILAKYTFKSEAEHWANEIMKEVFPDLEHDELELKTCHQCSGKKYVLIHIDHGNKSSTTWRVVCGTCFGTGFLPEIVQEYY